VGRLRQQPDVLQQGQHIRLDGHGVKGGAEIYRARGKALKESGYSPLLAFLK
jgi:hypothetical protein